jgi:hypothetical protein
MKCIKSIKLSKKVELGTTKRVGEKEAESEVKSGYWKYIPKSEYKTSTGKKEKLSVEDNQSETEQKPNKTKKNDKKNS